MIPGSANPLLLASAAAAGGYQVSRSLRFNSADSAYLSRTPAVAGNRQLMTQSLWIKRARITTGAEQNIFVCFNSGSDYSAINFKTDYVDQIQIINVVGGIVAHKITEPRLRDPSAWYHILWSIDEANGTAEDRFKLYINNQRVVNWALNSNSGGGNNWSFNRASVAHQFGSTGNADFYLADIHFIDGQALTPSSFTEVSATTGQLIPKAYSGTYGTNGFYLQFADNSSNTAATLGKDYSPNGNNWTPNNLSVTAGAGNDSLVDTPTSISATDTGVGGEIRGNYCTWNPLINTGLTISNGNLEVSGGGSPTKEAHGTLAMSNAGKWYFEITTTGSSLQFVGIGGSELNSSGASLSSYGYNEQGRLFINAADQGIQFSTYGSGDIIGFAVDLDANTIRFYKNGVAQGSGTTSIAANKNYSPLVNLFSGGGILNAGQRAFAYPLSGFKALCDTNLPAPVVAKPNTLMTAYLYTGNGSTAGRSLTGVGFSPDLVWIKDRSAGNWHQLRSTLQNGIMHSNETAAEQTSNANGIIGSLDSDGFTLSTSTNTPVLNTNNNAYVAWAWDAGTSTVTNTQGSITSQVRANVSAGFSVVTYTGNNTNSTVGHGLNVTPEMIIIKTRTTGDGWAVYHKSLGTPGSYNLRLNSTGSVENNPHWWNSTGPTSSVFSLGTSTGITNGSGVNYVAYCFSPVVGYSSFGSYTGNGSTDGPFVYTGFRPRWILIKPLYSYDGGGSTVASTAWYIYDSARGTYNGNGAILGANNAYSEENNATDIDFLSNGFKLRNTRAVNASEGAIYAAFAENPFQYARAR